MSLASFIQTAVFGPIVLSTEERPSPDPDAALAWWRKDRGGSVGLAHSALPRSVPTEPVPTSAANRLGVA